MPDPSPRRSRARAAARVATPARPQGEAAAAYVLGALLRGQPELQLLTKAVAGLAKLKLVDNRLGIVSTILRSRPGALVVPPFDAGRVSTAPLVLRVRREAPDVAVLVVSSWPAGAGQPVLRAAQAGAHVVTSPTPAELRDAISRLLERAS